MTANLPDPKQASAAQRAGSCLLGTTVARPRRRCARLSRPMSARSAAARAERDAAGADGRASRRLCRHRREGEAGGDLGPRQDRTRRRRLGVRRRRQSVPPGSPMERFFRRFGAPEDSARPGRRGRRAAASSRPARAPASSSRRRLCRDQQPRRRQGRRASRSSTDDGKTYTAKVIGTDPRTDLALIKVDGSGNFPFVKLAGQRAAHRRLGARGRQSVRPRRHGDGRHRLGARPRHRRRSL